MNFKRIFDDYLNYEKGFLKDSTIKIHQLIMRNIADAFFDLKIKTLKRIDDKLLNKIVLYLKQKDNRSNSYINRHIAMIINLMKYYHIKQRFNFKKLKYIDRSFERFYLEDLKMIFDTINNHKASENIFTYKTLIYLLLDTGARISEALSIKIDNITFQKPYRILLENTKTNVKRIVPFSDFSKNEICRLIEMNHKSEFLFYNFLKDRLISKNDVKLFYRRLERWTGIKKIHSHMFRKTFASMLIENGMPIEMLQILLGHSRITTTMIYTRFKNTMAIDQYNLHQDWKLKKED